MQKLSKTQPALIAILVMLCAALTVPFHAVSAAHSTRPQLESATIAKRLIGQMDRAKIERIKDKDARAELLRGFDALKAVADNTQQTREKILLARVHSSALKLKAQTQTAGIKLSDCENKMSTCSEMGTPPNLCQLNLDGCIMMARQSAYFPPGGPDGE